MQSIQCGSITLLGALLWSAVSLAQSEAARTPLAWRGTRLGWSQSVTAETLGVGSDVQTRNPTHEMTYAFMPRYYWYADGVQSVSVRGEIGMTRELTNSDTTTKRGEWSFTDALLYGAYGRLVHEAGEIGNGLTLPDGLLVSAGRDFETGVGLRLPVLTLPTSTVSRKNGTVLGLGADLVLSQALPLFGVTSEVLPGVVLDVLAGYRHTFTEATEATGAGFERVRMNTEGVPVVSDQLDGAALAEHQFTFAFSSTWFLTPRISWSDTWAWRPAYHYRFREDQELCGVVSTGCVTVQAGDDVRHHTVVTQFSSDLGFRVFDELGVSVGYTNLALQLGPDGKRRNIFYSPAARFRLAITMHLDELYQTATRRRHRPVRVATVRSPELR
jgi:hypothetical protein